MGVEQYDKAAAELIIANPPTGLLHHVCVPTDDGFMVIETWESEKAVEDFTTSDRFRREIGASGMPQPDMKIRPVHSMRAVVSSPEAPSFRFAELALLTRARPP